MMYEYPDIFTTFLKDSILFQQVNGLTELRWDKFILQQNLCRQ